MRRQRAALVLAAMLAVGLAAARTGSAAPAPARVHLIVAAKDLPAGATYSYDDIVQVEVPAWVAVKALIKADDARFIIGQRSSLPMLKGDLLRWSQFEMAGPAMDGCLKALGGAASPADAVQQARSAVEAR